MKNREKLVDLIAEAKSQWEGGTNNLDVRIADHLIDMGVTIRPKGRWTLNRDGSGTCSECHRTRNDVWDMDTWDNYCSHCGADMRDG